MAGKCNETEQQITATGLFLVICELTMCFLCVQLSLKKKEENKMITSTDKEKALDKNTQKTRNGRNLPGPHKEHQQNKTHLKSYLVVKDQMLSL